MSSELKDQVDFIVYPLSQNGETVKTNLAVIQVAVQPNRPDGLKVSDRYSLVIGDSALTSTYRFVELSTKKPYNFKLPDGTAARIVLPLLSYSFLASAQGNTRRRLSAHNTVLLAMVDLCDRHDSQLAEFRSRPLVV